MPIILISVGKKVGKVSARKRKGWGRLLSLKYGVTN